MTRPAAPSTGHRARRHLAALALAVLAVALAGCGGTSDRQDDAGTGEGAAVEATSSPATFVAVDIAYEEAPSTLPAGSHTIELVNDGALPHTVTMEELGDRDVVETAAGETATGEVELDAGSYTYYCSVPGHREAGMEGTLEVTDA